MSFSTNAGGLEENHWALDADFGGGRIIGEACHFVDLAQYWCGARITSVYAAAARSPGRPPAEPRAEQDVTCVLTFADGSSAAIVYASRGDPTRGKERCEIFGGGACAAIEDFRILETSRGGKRKVVRFGGSAKGQAEEMALFADFCLAREPMPQEFVEFQLLSSLATILIPHSIRAGAVQQVATESIL